MEITFYGVRGTVAIPGESTNEFGGNTSCVHVKTAKGYDIVLDAGTGICGLARKLLGTPLGKGQGELAIQLSSSVPLVSEDGGVSAKFSLHAGETAVFRSDQKALRIIEIEHTGR